VSIKSGIRSLSIAVFSHCLQKWTVPTLLPANLFVIFDLTYIYLRLPLLSNCSIQRIFCLYTHSHRGRKRTDIRSKAAHKDLTETRQRPQEVSMTKLRTITLNISRIQVITTLSIDLKHPSSLQTFPRRC
jgi:hypothetical protein